MLGLAVSSASTERSYGAARGAGVGTGRDIGWACGKMPASIYRGKIPDFFPKWLDGWGLMQCSAGTGIWRGTPLWAARKSQIPNPNLKQTDKRRKGKGANGEGGAGAFWFWPGVSVWRFFLYPRKPLVWRQVPERRTALPFYLFFAIIRNVPFSVLDN